MVYFEPQLWISSSLVSPSISKLRFDKQTIVSIPPSPPMKNLMRAGGGFFSQNKLWPKDTIKLLKVDLCRIEWETGVAAGRLEGNGRGYDVEMRVVGVMKKGWIGGGQAMKNIMGEKLPWPRVMRPVDIEIISHRSSGGVSLTNSVLSHRR